MARHLRLIALLMVGCWVTPNQATRPIAQSSSLSADASTSCMKRLWTALIPAIASNNGYLAASDIERIAGLKLSPPVSVTPTDTISSLQLDGPYTLSASIPGSAIRGRAWLSLRLELHSGSAVHMFPSWQRMQRRINGTKSSNFDLTCADGGRVLSLRDAEADLEAIGLKRVGMLSQPKPVEVFYQDMKGRVDLYYETPAETVPYVISIHVAGAEIKKARP
jgi:hypothetical protein